MLTYNISKINLATYMSAADMRFTIALFTWDPPPEVDSNPDGPGDPDSNLDRLHLHGAESGNGSRKVVSCKRGYCLHDCVFSFKK